MISLLSNRQREREKTALTSAFPTSWYTHRVIERLRAAVGGEGVGRKGEINF
jgi:hypothetical protein